MQSLFEASMYTFIFLWTPALSPGGEKIPHGLVFACFMTACMAGSAAAGLLMRDPRVGHGGSDPPDSSNCGGSDPRVAKDPGPRGGRRGGGGEEAGGGVQEEGLGAGLGLGVRLGLRGADVPAPQRYMAAVYGVAALSLSVPLFYHTERRDLEAEARGRWRPGWRVEALARGRYRDCSKAKGWRPRVAERRVCRIQGRKENPGAKRELNKQKEAKGLLHYCLTY